METTETITIEGITRVLDQEHLDKTVKLILRRFNIDSSHKATIERTYMAIQSMPMVGPMLILHKPMRAADIVVSQLLARSLPSTSHVEAIEDDARQIREHTHAK